MMTAPKDKMVSMPVGLMEEIGLTLWKAGKFELCAAINEYIFTDEINFFTDDTDETFSER